MLGQQGHLGHLRVPDHVLDVGGRELGHVGALLDVKEHDLVLGAAEQEAGPGVEDRVRAGVGHRALLGDLVAQVLDLDLALALVEHRKAVAGDEGRGGSGAALRLLQADDREHRQRELSVQALAQVSLDSGERNEGEGQGEGGGGGGGGGTGGPTDRGLVSAARGAVLGDAVELVRAPSAS